LHYLGITLPKDLQISDWSAPVLSKGQLAYAALDAILALKLYVVLRAELLKKGRAGAYQIQCACIPAVVDMAARGLLLDKAAHQATQDGWRAGSSGSYQAYIAQVGSEPPRTPEQTRDLLRAKVPADVLKTWPRTAKKGQLSTATDHLTRVAASIPEIAHVITIKKYEKLLGTFSAEMAKRVGTDGRLHASFNVAGTKTGRMSCSDPNMQQLPRDPLTRNCFVAADGYLLVVADYNMMELRGAAEVANDAELRANIAQGLDQHRLTASVVNGVPYDQVTPEQRNAAKAINFGIIFGAGGAGIAYSVWADYGIVMSPKQGTAARDRFLYRYRGLARWMRVNADRCNHRGYITIGIGGRVVEAEWELVSKPRVSRWSDPDGDDTDAAVGDVDDVDDACRPITDSERAYIAYIYPQRLRFTMCCNLPIQGACADTTMLALAFTHRLFRINNIGGGLVLAVHDELVAEVREDQAQQAAKLIEQAMTATFLRVFPDAPVNGLVKVMIVKKWGEAKG
jgi:DNA polymerase-1